MATVLALADREEVHVEMKPEDLEGRELDRAIAEELGLLNHALDLPKYVPEFHASVDALREVEPGDADISLSLTRHEGRRTWAATIWHDFEIEGGYTDYEIAAEAEGSTEALARARALLAWLRRGDE